MYATQPIFSGRAFTYEVLTPPANLAVLLDDFKYHSKYDGTTSDTLMTIYLKTAIEYAEKMTRRDFVNRTYKTFRDGFPGTEVYDHYSLVNQGNVGFEIRKSKLQSVTSVKYLVDNALTTVASTVYYATSESGYSKILTLDGQVWPTNADIRLQAVEIEFVAGYGADDTDVPDDLQEAILVHATQILENRSDCKNANVMDKVPEVCRLIYKQNRIENL